MSPGETDGRRNDGIRPRMEACGHQESETRRSIAVCRRGDAAAPGARLQSSACLVDAYAWSSLFATAARCRSAGRRLRAMSRWWWQCRARRQGSEPPRYHAAMATMQIKVKDRKSTRLNSSHVKISYAVFC